MGAIENRRWSWWSRYDPATTLLLLAMAVRPTPQRIQLIDKTIRSLKLSGIWSKLDLLYVTAAHDVQAAKLNWKSPPSYLAIAANSPTFEADKGFTGDGSSARLRTQFTPSTNGVNFSQDNSSCWVWVATNISSAASDIGNNATTAQARIVTRYSVVADTIYGRLNDAAATAFGTGITTSVGFSGLQRRGASDKRAWKNGAQIGTTSTEVSVGLPTGEQWLCGANSTSFSTRQISAAAWGASLSGLETTFYNILLAYMQGVGNT